jgi:hypothetical protein
MISSKESEWDIDSLGEGTFSSREARRDFVHERDRILLDISIPESSVISPSLELAGPRRTLFHDPPSITVAIVTW